MYMRIYKLIEEELFDYKLKPSEWRKRETLAIHKSFLLDKLLKEESMQNEGIVKHSVESSSWDYVYTDKSGREVYRTKIEAEFLWTIEQYKC